MLANPAIFMQLKQPDLHQRLHTSMIQPAKYNRVSKSICHFAPFLLLPISWLLGGCAVSKAPEINGETLIQQMPLPGGEWKVSQFPPKETPILETRWRSTSSNELMQTFVLYQTENADVYKPKLVDDKTGKTTCDLHFSSTVISAAGQNGYPQLTWRTLCQKSSGHNAIVLHKVISGNEAQYVFRRTFSTLPTKENWLVWLNYMRSITVCNWNKPDKHPCPVDVVYK